MKKKFFKTLASLNKKILPSYSKQEDFDLAKANKLQMALIGWKIWVTKNSLD
ncbi:SsrA-binding protein [Gramella sp. AN32]|uniref:SsrA-binding protein n=1 Tax=Christiangramia antarctica TaxID=2058158 RepID=A0ABW5X721_9FLAO|nr:SsrA-binding protein [Gramella sp. AN32]MCM4157851.1 SsrA-binding protein [Gramella sp. AN32]